LDHQQPEKEKQSDEVSHLEKCLRTPMPNTSREWTQSDYEVALFVSQISVVQLFLTFGPFYKQMTSCGTLLIK